MERFLGDGRRRGPWDERNQLGQQFSGNLKRESFFQDTGSNELKGRFFWRTNRFRVGGREREREREKEERESERETASVQKQIE